MFDTSAEGGWAGSTAPCPAMGRRLYATASHPCVRTAPERRADVESAWQTYLDSPGNVWPVDSAVALLAGNSPRCCLNLRRLWSALTDRRIASGSTVPLVLRHSDCATALVAAMPLLWLHRRVHLHSL